jgi:ribosomal protein L12E/L44/L45/RPP1/RPP2
LSIKGSEQIQIQDLDFIVGNLAVERESKGACGLREVDIHVDASRAASVAAAVSPASPGMKVTIVSDSESDDDDEVDIEDPSLVGDEESSAYMLGGIFNDPFFDAYYMAQLAAR